MLLISVPTFVLEPSLPASSVPPLVVTLVYQPAGGFSCCSTPPPPFEEAPPPRTSRTNSSSTTSSSASGRRRGASSAASVMTTSSASSLALTPAALSSARSNEASVCWTPPVSVEGSTPTWTEGTPSFTESSSSEQGYPVTPARAPPVEGRRSPRPAPPPRATHTIDCLTSEVVEISHLVSETSRITVSTYEVNRLESTDDDYAALKKTADFVKKRSNSTHNGSLSL